MTRPVRETPPVTAIVPIADKREAERRLVGRMFETVPMIVQQIERILIREGLMLQPSLAIADMMIDFINKHAGRLPNVLKLISLTDEVPPADALRIRLHRRRIRERYSRRRARKQFQPLASVSFYNGTVETDMEIVVTRLAAIASARRRIAAAEAEEEAHRPDPTRLQYLRSLRPVLNEQTKPVFDEIEAHSRLRPD